jgi:hypothetical protein
MAARFSTNLFRPFAVATTLVLLAGAAAPARAAIRDTLLSFPGIKDYLAADSNLVFVGNNCATCPGSCPCGPSAAAGEEGADQSGEPLERAAMDAEQFGGLGSDTFTVNDAVGGYIDNPIVGNWFRARYDVAVNNPNPDLAEFFYAKYGLAGGPGVNPPTTAQFSPTSVNFQVGTFYLELLVAPRLSVFAELAIQRTDMFFPDGAGDAVLIKNGGLGDTIAGLKYALYTDECQYLTFQFKTYAPTGDARRGLGTRHVSLEPGLLYLRQISDRAYFQGELRYWIPVGGTDYAGNILRYGAGIGYDIIGSYRDTGPLNPYVSTRGLRVTAVTEFVGWSVFDGRFTPGNVPGQNVASEPVPDGFTVVNVKPGFRFTKNCGSVYAGAGIAITGDRWYSDLFRLEYRRMF